MEMLRVVERDLQVRGCRVGWFRQVGDHATNLLFWVDEMRAAEYPIH